MEPLAILAALTALGLLAQRYGYDSRERPCAAEERLATAGFHSADRGAAPAAWPASPPTLHASGNELLTIS